MYLQLLHSARNELIITVIISSFKESHSLATKENLTFEKFSSFAKEFNKNYNDPTEFQKRYGIFKENLKTIDQLNKNERGTAVYGVTQFSDLTFPEFIANFTGGKLSSKQLESHAKSIENEIEENILFEDEIDLESEQSSSSEESEEEYEDEDGIQYLNGKVILPKAIDYRAKKAVTPVKNQGNCGSCWAFSTIANIEGINAKKNKKLLDLSEQELLDCDKKDAACRGGWMQNACKELVRIGGVMLQKDYPYQAQPSTCKFNSKKVALKITGTKSIPTNENQIAKSLVKIGPLSVGVVVTSNFQFYKKGVFDPSPTQCSTNGEDVNHGVAAIGYGVDHKKLYWILKNSWGSNWGEKGYMKLARGKKACAVHSYVSTATL